MWPPLRLSYLGTARRLVPGELLPLLRAYPKNRGEPQASARAEPWGHLIGRGSKLDSRRGRPVRPSFFLLTRSVNLTASGIRIPALEGAAFTPCACTTIHCCSAEMRPPRPPPENASAADDLPRLRRTPPTATAEIRDPNSVSFLKAGRGADTYSAERKGSPTTCARLPNVSKMDFFPSADPITSCTSVIYNNPRTTQEKKLYHLRAPASPVCVGSVPKKEHARADLHSQVLA